MKVSFLAVAVILCGLGCSNGVVPKLEPCTLFSGYLYIFNTSTKTIDGEEGENWTYEIRGSSGAPPSEKIEYLASSVGEVTVMKLDRIEVYDCLASIKAAHGFLQNFMTNALTDSKDNSKLSLDMQTLQHKQLLDAVKDAVALWTDYRWWRVCQRKPGFVYIMRMSTSTKVAEQTKWVFMIKGSSGIPPSIKINRISSDGNEPKIFEMYRCQVKNCDQAIGQIFYILNTKGASDHGIRPATKYGTFFVPATQSIQFHKLVRDAIVQLLLKVPPTNQPSWGESEAGYLYDT